MTTAGRVLVVEDDEIIRESLVEFLVEQGYEASGAVHGRAALDHLSNAAARPNVIILDLMMPVMDGREFRQRQLADPLLSGIPVVIISAYRDLDQVAKELAPAGCFKKPLKLRDFLRIVEQHCGATCAPRA